MSENRYQCVECGQQVNESDLTRARMTGCPAAINYPAAINHFWCLVYQAPRVVHWNPMFQPISTYVQYMELVTTADGTEQAELLNEPFMLNGRVYLTVPESGFGNIPKGIGHGAQ